MSKKQTDFIMMPKVDFCFKELMSDAEVRKGFLCALLNLRPEDVTETVLLPTHLRKEHEDDKQGILDVRIYLNNKVEIDIEIQVLMFKFWEERSLFYLCKMFSDQIKEGESYQKLGKCIHVGILDYILFPEDEAYYSRFHLKEDYRERIYSDKLEIHILELPKLGQHLYPQDALLNWARFFKAEQKEELAAMAKTDQYIEKAYDKLLHISADEEKRLEYEARQKAIRDYNHLMKCSWDDGLEQGIKVLIKTCNDFGASRNDVLERIMQNFELSEETVQSYLDKYWKEK